MALVLRVVFLSIFLQLFPTKALAAVWEFAIIAPGRVSYESTVTAGDIQFTAHGDPAGWTDAHLNFGWQYLFLQSYSISAAGISSPVFASTSLLEQPFLADLPADLYDSGFVNHLIELRRTVNGETLFEFNAGGIIPAAWSQTETDIVVPASPVPPFVRDQPGFFHWAGFRYPATSGSFVSESGQLVTYTIDPRPGDAVRFIAGPVPEPSTILLLTLGFAGLAVARGKRLNESST